MRLNEYPRQDSNLQPSAPEAGWDYDLVLIGNLNPPRIYGTGQKANPPQKPSVFYAVFLCFLGILYRILYRAAFGKKTAQPVI